MYNYFRHINDVLWTCYKRAFIAHNLRATNDYSHTHTLVYAVNRFKLSEMIQWTFRSRIRNNESINIYIPSSRMRNLLIEFLKTVNKSVEF